MKTIRNLSLMAALVWATACGKELSAIDESNVSCVSFGFEVMPLEYTMTKAENINQDELDDFIDRIDMYEYNKAGDMIRHESWSDPEGVNLDTVKPVSYDVSGNKHNWVFIANLDPETAEYLAGLDADGFSDVYSGVIPMEAGNFRLHKPIMTGTADADFKKNESMTVTLYRYLTRIEIERITADFDDVSLYDKDVKIKRIVITHYPNILKLLYKHVSDVWGTYQDMLGIGYTKFSDPAFGNLLKLNNECNEINIPYKSDFDDTFSLAEYGGKGKLADDYPYLLNYNKLLGEGELVVDAEGDQLAASCHVFGDDEGVLCSSLNNSAGQYCEVDKVFYTINMARNSYNYLVGNYNEQDDCQKLVIEVEFDGVPYFYIISLRELNAGMTYKVKNITLKNLGSRYSNKYIRKYATDAAIESVAEWSEHQMDNIQVGYTVDGYDIYGYE